MYRFSCCLMISAVASTLIASVQDPYFLGVGDLPGGYYTSFPQKISSDGAAVVGVSWGQPFGGGDYPFIWSRESGIQPLLPSNELRGGQQKRWLFAGRRL